MLQHLTDRDSLIDIAVEHQPNKIDTGLTHDVRYAQVVIHNLIDAVERVFLVDDGVEQDPQSPDILFFAAVGLSGEDFRRGVIYSLVRNLVPSTKKRKNYQ